VNDALSEAVAALKVAAGTMQAPELVDIIPPDDRRNTLVRSYLARRVLDKEPLQTLVRPYSCLQPVRLDDVFQMLAGSARVSLVSIAVCVQLIHRFRRFVINIAARLGTG
jgi:hypothetical protein